MWLKVDVFRQDGRDIDIADGQFLGHDTACQIIRAGAAIVLGQGHRTQPHLRGPFENLVSSGRFEWLQALGLEGDRLDFLRDEVPDRIAELQLLCH